MIHILIADDQELMRDGLATILNLRPEIDVVGTAKDGQEAFEKVKELGADIVLMDIRMANFSGVHGTKLICRYLPDVKVLMLTTFTDSGLIFEALKEGASGYLLKDMPTDTIVQAIMTVHAGGMVLPPELTKQLLNEIKRTNRPESSISCHRLPSIIKELTERERDVLVQIGYGCSNKEIADALFITEGTVKNHVSNIIGKLQVRDRTQAAIFAVRYGITPFDT